MGVFSEIMDIGASCKNKEPDTVPSETRGLSPLSALTGGPPSKKSKKISGDKHTDNIDIG